MKISIKDKVLYSICFIVFVFLVYLIIGAVFKIRSLTANLEFTNAVISGFSTGTRAKCYINYSFFVDDIKYQGGGKHYIKTDTFSIGDTILIVYDSKNPKSSQPYRDYKRSKKEEPFIIPFFILLGWFIWWAYRKK